MGSLTGEPIAVGDETHELVEAQAHVRGYFAHFMTLMSLKCAIQLGIGDAIHGHGHPIPLSQLAAAVGIPPSKTAHLGRLMRLLRHTGFFSVRKTDNASPEMKEEEEEGYVLTPSSELLLRGVEPTILPFALFVLDPIMLKTYDFLSEWFLGKTPSVFEIAHGSPFFEFTSGNPEFSSVFNEGMASDARFTMALALSKCGNVFEGLRSLVDVGGGTGAAAEAIANAFPHMKCSVFDLPHVVTSAPKKNNVTMVGGDMFQSIPSADAIFLKWILHDWSDEECVTILKRCKEVIPSREEGGKVIILEMVVNSAGSDHKEIELQLVVDVSMMISTTGKERDEKEWQNIFFGAGFTHYEITPITGACSIIEIYP